MPRALLKGELFGLGRSGDACSLATGQSHAILELWNSACFLGEGEREGEREDEAGGLADCGFPEGIDVMLCGYGKPLPWLELLEVFSTGTA